MIQYPVPTERSLDANFADLINGNSTKQRKNVLQVCKVILFKFDLGINDFSTNIAKNLTVSRIIQMRQMS